MTASDQSATTMAEIDLDKLEALAKAALKAKGDNARWEALDALEAAANPATILDLIASARRDAEEIERLRDSNEGLRTDLFYAVQTAYRSGATEWARLNYPQWIDAIEANSARAAHTGEG